MPGYEERASIRQDAEAIFNMVCDRETWEEWAEWLRVPLKLAARTANADLVDKLLKAGADVSAGFKGCNDQTLLHAAAEGRNEDVLSAFMGAGAKEDMDTKTQANGRTPLNFAVRGGKVAAVDALLLAGADVNILDADNKGPLHLAITGGHTGVAKNLLLRGADPEQKGLRGRFPIHIAARHGQDEVVRNLLHAGAQVNRLDDDGWIPLHHAVWHGRLSTVKVLLGKGADLAIGSSGHTPLYLAALKNNTEILAALVEAGVDIEAKDRRGYTPLHSIAYHGLCAAMLALLQLGADVHARTTKRGYTLLHLAVKRESLRLRTCC